MIARAVLLAVLLLTTAHAGAGVYEVSHGNYKGNHFGPWSASTTPQDVTTSGGLLNGQWVTGAGRAVASSELLRNELQYERATSPYGASNDAYTRSRVTIDDIEFFSLADPAAAGTIDILITSSWSTAVTNDKVRGRMSHNLTFDDARSGSFSSYTGDIYTNFPGWGLSRTGSHTLEVSDVALNSIVSLTALSEFRMNMSSAFDPGQSGSGFGEVALPGFILPEGFGWRSVTLDHDDSVTAVPAPGSLALLCLGATGLLLRARRPQLLRSAASST